MGNSMSAEFDGSEEESAAAKKSGKTSREANEHNKADNDTPETPGKEAKPKMTAKGSPKNALIEDEKISGAATIILADNGNIAHVGSRVLIMQFEDAEEKEENEKATPTTDEIIDQQPVGTLEANLVPHEKPSTDDVYGKNNSGSTEASKSAPSQLDSLPVAVSTPDNKTSKVFGCAPGIADTKKLEATLPPAKAKKSSEQEQASDQKILPFVGHSNSPRSQLSTAPDNNSGPAFNRTSNPPASHIVKDFAEKVPAAATVGGSSSAPKVSSTPYFCGENNDMVSCSNILVTVDRNSTANAGAEDTELPNEERTANSTATVVGAPGGESSCPGPNYSEQDGISKIESKRLEPLESAESADGTEPSKPAASASSEQIVASTGVDEDSGQTSNPIQSITGDEFNTEKAVSIDRGKTEKRSRLKEAGESSTPAANGQTTSHPAQSKNEEEWNTDKEVLIGQGKAEAGESSIAASNPALSVNEAESNNDKAVSIDQGKNDAGQTSIATVNGHTTSHPAQSEKEEESNTCKSLSIDPGKAENKGPAGDSSNAAAISVIAEDSHQSSAAKASEQGSPQGNPTEAANGKDPQELKIAENSQTDKSAPSGEEETSNTYKKCASFDENPAKRKDVDQDREKSLKKPPPSSQHSIAAPRHNDTEQPSIPSAMPSPKPVERPNNLMGCATQAHPGKRSQHKLMLFQLFLQCDKERLQELAGKNYAEELGIQKETANSAKHNCFGEGGRKRDPRLSLLPVALQEFRDATQDVTYVDIAGGAQRRKGFSSLSLSELESRVRANFVGSALFQNLSGADVEVESSRQTGAPKSQERVFAPFSLEYNECSMEAIATWAAKATWTAKEKAKPYKTSTDTPPVDRPTVPSLFRKCQVCGSYGHYEIECNKMTEEYALDLAHETMVHANVGELLEKRRDQNELNFRQVGLEKKLVADRATIDESEEDFSREHLACEVCRSHLDDDRMLICDGCDKLCHLYCLIPALKKVPEGDWFCKSCAEYSTDVTSDVEIEGCGGFVIEQRKRPREEEASKEQKKLGLPFKDWQTAVAVVHEEPVLSIDPSKSRGKRRRPTVGDRKTEIDGFVVHAKEVALNSPHVTNRMRCLAQPKAVSQEELTPGSTVAWFPSAEADTIGTEDANPLVGTVLAVDASSRKALVRRIDAWEEILADDDTSDELGLFAPKKVEDCAIRAVPAASTFWQSADELHIVARAPSKQTVEMFRSKVLPARVAREKKRQPQKPAPMTFLSRIS
jgi:hypothetical protein